MWKKMIAAVSIAAMLGTTGFASVAQAGPRYHRVYHGGHKTVIVHKHHRPHYRYHRRRGGKGAAVAAGVLGGIVLGSIIADAAEERRARRRAPHTVYVPQPVPAYQPRATYVEPTPVVPPVQNNRVVYADPTAHPFQGRDCVQVREYQTTIQIGGRDVPAYGQACLQPDGYWLQSPAQPERGYR